MSFTAMSFLAHSSIAIRVHYLALTIKPTGMNRLAGNGLAGRSHVVPTAARMSLHRNASPKFGVVRMNRRRYSPLSFRPASDARVTAQWRRRRRTSRREPPSSPTADIGRR